MGLLLKNKLNGGDRPVRLTGVKKMDGSSEVPSTTGIHKVSGSSPKTSSNKATIKALGTSVSRVQSILLGNTDRGRKLNLEPILTEQDWNSYVEQAKQIQMKFDEKKRTDFLQEMYFCWRGLQARFNQKAMEAIAAEPKFFYEQIMASLEAGASFRHPDHIYIIPRYNTQLDKKVACVELGYKGMLAIAQKHCGVKAMKADVVYEEDEFVWKETSKEGVLLEHTVGGKEDRGKRQLAYAYASFKEIYDKPIVGVRLYETELQQNLFDNACDNGKYKCPNSIKNKGQAAVAKWKREVFQLENVDAWIEYAPNVYKKYPDLWCGKAAYRRCFGTAVAQHVEDIAGATGTDIMAQVTHLQDQHMPSALGGKSIAIETEQDDTDRLIGEVVAQHADKSLDELCKVFLAKSGLPKVLPEHKEQLVALIASR